MQFPKVPNRGKQSLPNTFNLSQILISLQPEAIAAAPKKSLVEVAWTVEKMESVARRGRPSGAKRIAVCDCGRTLKTLESELQDPQHSVVDLQQACAALQLLQGRMWNKLVSLITLVEDHEGIMHELLARFEVEIRTFAGGIEWEGPAD